MNLTTVPITLGLGSIWRQSGSSAKRICDSATWSALLTLSKGFFLPTVEPFKNPGNLISCVISEQGCLQEVGSCMTQHSLLVAWWLELRGRALGILAEAVCLDVPQPSARSGPCPAALPLCVSFGGSGAAGEVGASALPMEHPCNWMVLVRPSGMREKDPDLPVWAGDFL